MTPLLNPSSEAPCACAGPCKYAYASKWALLRPRCQPHSVVMNDLTPAVAAGPPSPGQAESSSSSFHRKSHQLRGKETLLLRLMLDGVASSRLGRPISVSVFPAASYVHSYAMYAKNCPKLPEILSIWRTQWQKIQHCCGRHIWLLPNSILSTSSERKICISPRPSGAHKRAMPAVILATSTKYSSQLLARRAA